MLDFVPIKQSTLNVEGDNCVIDALTNDTSGVHVCAPGGGVSGSFGSGLAPALETLQMYRKTPITGTCASVGSINMALLLYGKGVTHTQCYANEFCSDRFIKKGIVPWFDRTKVSVDYCAAVLYHKLRDAKPYHPDNRIHICVTNYETGEPAVLSPDLGDIKRVVRCIKASIYLPCVGKGYVMIDGVPYTDGEIGQGLLKATLEHDPKFLLLLMSTPKNPNFQWVRNLKEHIMAKRAMTDVPRLTREGMLSRHVQHKLEEAWIDDQLKLSPNHTNRKLPLTCRVSPTRTMNVVEQNRDRITEAVGTSYQAWLELLSWHK